MKRKSAAKGDLVRRELTEELSLPSDRLHPGLWTYSRTINVTLLPRLVALRFMLWFINNRLRMPH
jgi:hypothetical protein